MAYIVVLNPLILGFAKDVNGDFLGGGAGDGSNLPAIAAGTALVAGLLTILMGVVANYPLALATGLGLNAFVAFAIASQMTWADAMGLAPKISFRPRAHRLPAAVFHAVPATEDRHLRRHRLFIAPSACRCGLHPRTGGPVPSSSGRGQSRLADLVSPSAAARHRPVGAKVPARSSVVITPRSWRSSSRPSPRSARPSRGPTAQQDQPARLEPQRACAARQGHRDA
jgi:hypothetical protein